MPLKRFLSAPSGVLPAVALGILCAALGEFLPAAPFSRVKAFRQPDGSLIQLQGRGDEFGALFETLDGYTVVFHPPARAYHFAALSPDGNDLVSAGVAVGEVDPASLGLRKHLRARTGAATKRYRERRAESEGRTGLARRWEALKARSADFGNGLRRVPPDHTTTGTKVGICLPVCFSDSPPEAEIKPSIEEINSYYNGSAGSIKAFFSHCSNSKLQLAHVVPEKWIRLSNTKAYYDDLQKDYSTQGMLLVNEALAALKADPAYDSAIFKDVTTYADGNAVSVSFIYYGPSQDVDGYGLYPFQGSLETPFDLGSGKKVKYFALTDCGVEFNVATMCHEIGHMVCSFPDMYQNSVVDKGPRLPGVGAFCVMGLGDAHTETKPTQFCAYLKYKAGWATLVAPPYSTVSLDSSGGGFNQFFRFPKNGTETSKEYFIVENRSNGLSVGWDNGLPGSGIVVYQVDETGNNLEPASSHYECRVLEADGDFSMEKDAKDYGQANDFFFKGNSAPGYANAFSDSTKPPSKWWDGTTSGLKMRDFSDIGAQMTFVVDNADKLSVSDIQNVGAAGKAVGTPPPLRWGKAPNQTGGQHVRYGQPFQVSVLARDGSSDPAAVEVDTPVLLSLGKGTGVLGGVLGGVIKAGASIATISGATYSKAEAGVVLKVTCVGGDPLDPADSDPFDEVPAPWLAVTGVNGGAGGVRAGLPFSVRVEAQDEFEKPLQVSADTEVVLSLASGSGELDGELVGVIQAGDSGVTVAGVTYSEVETGVEITASVVRGDELSDGDSAPFNVGSSEPQFIFGACDMVMLTCYIGVPPELVPPYALAVYDFNSDGEIDLRDRETLAEFLSTSSTTLP